MPGGITTACPRPRAAGCHELANSKRTRISKTRSRRPGRQWRRNKVVLDQHGVSRTGREAATALFELLKQNGIVQAEAENTVLGAARIRNQEPREPRSL
jgi:hypothetical protein